MSNYKRLDVWQQSMELVKEIYLTTKKFPKEELYALTSQTKRAAVSIPCNIAEGVGRNYKKDTIQFLHVSRGSLYELETLLVVAFNTGILMLEKYSKLNEMVEKTLQVLGGLIRYLGKAELK